MKIVGITGQSGVGKSTLAKKLVALGAVHLDGDQVAHALQRPGTAYYGEILAAFGENICKENGEINRKALGQLVFSDKKALETLNGLTKGHVTAAIEEEISKAERQGAKVVLVDAIGLLESGLGYDLLVAVVADRGEQVARIVGRDGISREAAEARLQSQKSEEFYTKRANFVVHSGDDVQGIWEAAVAE